MMGGFRFRTTTATSEGEFVEGSPDLILTPRGIEWLAEYAPALMPSLNEDDVRGRSKTDSLVKVIVCLQAIYISAQCAARKAQNLPITLLELNTFGHAMCALLMYAFWFRKLKDVSHSSIIEGDDARSHAAAFWSNNSEETSLPMMVSLYESYPESRLFLWAQHQDGEVDWQPLRLENFRRLGPFGPEVEKKAKAMLQRYESINAASLARRNTASVARNDDRLREPETAFESYLKSDTTLDSFRKALYEALLCPHALAAANTRPDRNPRCVDTSGSVSRQGSQQENCSKPDCSGQHTIDPRHGVTNDKILPQLGCWKLFDDERSNELPMLNFQMVNRLTLAADMYEALIQQAHLLESTPCSQDSRVGALEFDIVYQLSRWMNLVERTSCDWTHDYSYEWQDLIPICVISCITGAYGGLHALAWYSHFPTTTEQLLWRISSLLIAASGILATFSNAIAARNRPCRWCGLRLRLTGQPLHARLLISLTETFFELLVEPSWFYLTHSMKCLEDSRLKYARPVISWMLVALFVSARVFIVIEVYISLRSLPESAYRTPDWPNWIPHL